MYTIIIPVIAISSQAEYPKLNRNPRAAKMTSSFLRSDFFSRKNPWKCSLNRHEVPKVSEISFGLFHKPLCSLLPSASGFLEWVLGCLNTFSLGKKTPEIGSLFSKRLASPTLNKIHQNPIQSHDAKTRIQFTCPCLDPIDSLVFLSTKIWKLPWLEILKVWMRLLRIHSVSNVLSRCYLKKIYKFLHKFQQHASN